jgi:RNA polymerase sigma-70 factor (ECF subfamily)
MLVRSFIPALRRFAWGLCHNTDLADDLVQDCLERAVLHWQTRRADGNLRAWLFTILRNEFINDRRRLARHGASVSLDDLPIDPVVEGGQERSLQVSEVLSAVDRLSADDRSLMLLIAVEEFSYQEAADVLGIPIGTVMSRLSRARERLRSMLKERVR